MFDEGILEIYKKIQGKSAGGKPVDVLEIYGTAFYGEIDFTVNEYYAAKQSETQIEKRIRIPQDKTICNKHVIVIDGIQYDVGRPFSSIVKGVRVTDITLERVTTKYDSA